MNLQPYKDVLTMGKEKAKAILIPVRVKKAKKRAELEMLKLEEVIATLEADIEELSAAEELDFPKLIDSLDNLAIEQRRIEQYEAVIKQLFPDDTASNPA